MEVENAGYGKTPTSHNPHSQGYHQMRGKRYRQNDDTYYEPKSSKRKFKGKKLSNEQSNTENGKSTKILETKDGENSKGFKNSSQENIHSDEDTQLKTSTNKEDSRGDGNNVNDNLFMENYPNLNQNKPNNQTIPNLFDKNNEIFTRYWIISPKNPNDDLENMSGIEILKTLEKQNIKSSTYKQQKLKGNKILFTVKNARDSERLQHLTQIGKIAINIEPHKTLNYSKGVINSYNLRGCKREELMEMCEIIHEAYNPVKKTDDQSSGRTIREPTNTWILTFNTPNRPKYLMIPTFERIEVKPYIPKPMRCYKCDRYGHTTKRCQNWESTCKRCGRFASAHEEDIDYCEEPYFCINCNIEGHTASNSMCPRWKQETKICEYMAIRNIPYKQARDHLVEQKEIPSYRDILEKRKNNEDPNRKNMSEQHSMLTISLRQETMIW